MQTYLGKKHIVMGIYIHVVLELIIEILWFMRYRSDRFIVVCSPFRSPRPCASFSPPPPPSSLGTLWEWTRAKASTAPCGRYLVCTHLNRFSISTHTTCLTNNTMFVCLSIYQPQISLILLFFFFSLLSLDHSAWPDAPEGENWEALCNLLKPSKSKL